MPSPPVHADECIDRPLVERLRERGFEVVTALEAGMGSEPDAAQLAYAADQDRVLLLDWPASPGAGGHHSRLTQWNDLQQLLHSGSRRTGYTEAQVRHALGEAEP